MKYFKKKSTSDDIFLDEKKAFSKIRSFPKNRWFNSLVMICIIVSFVFIGVILGCLIIIFL
ncbi:MAG: hypothetical protein RSA87_03730 [Malacoplasma sp.]